eukprot:6226034-Amphidinium_carterae.2
MPAGAVGHPGGMGGETSRGGVGAGGDLFVPPYTSLPECIIRYPSAQSVLMHKNLKNTGSNTKTCPHNAQWGIKSHKSILL